jgi:hypothetical protein
MLHLLLLLKVVFDSNMYVSIKNRNMFIIISVVV